MKSISSMLTQLHPLIKTDDLTDWEKSFIRSIWNQSEEGKDTKQLTSKQVDVVNKIYDKHFGDNT